MSFISIRGLVHDYVIKNESGDIVETKRALDGINLEIPHGQFVAILGNNGSGKTTLARHLNALLLPTEGEVEVDGMNTKDEELLYEIRKKAGMVFQNPDNQMVGTLVEDEVGFGPENLGMSVDDIWSRVDRSLMMTDMEECRQNSPNRLSGGQKQRVAAAGILAMLPECMILDEATSMLDPQGRAEFLRTVLDLKKNENITIVLITHETEEAKLADRVIVMEHGRILCDGSPEQIFSSENLSEERCAVSGESTQISEKVDLKVEIEKAAEKEIGGKTDVEISLENVYYEYDIGTSYSKTALKNINLEIYRGEFIEIVGHTGSGKSTLIQLMGGLLTPSSGEVKLDGRSLSEREVERSWLCKEAGVVFQYPEHQIFQDEVLKDIMTGPLNLGFPKSEAEEKARRALLSVGLQEEIGHKSPYALSGGERRRVAIAGVLAMEPDILILDEPCAGLDTEGRRNLLNLLERQNKEEGRTVILVSHQINEVKTYADRIIEIDRGELVAVQKDSAEEKSKTHGRLEENREDMSVYRKRKQRRSSGISLGQFYPEDSLIHKLDPRIKLFALLLFLFAVFFHSDIYWYLFLTAILLAIRFVSKIPLRLFARAFRKIMFFLLFTSAFCLLTTEGKEVWSVGVIHITEEGILRGFLLLWRLMLAVAGSSLLTFATTPGDISDGLAKVMKPLRKIGVPVGDLSMIVSISIKFIPILMEETDKIRKAQMARGMDFRKGSVMVRAKKLASIFIPLFVSSVRRAFDLALAMEARCYRGGDLRSRMKPLKYVKSDFIAYGILFCFLGLCVAMKVVYYII